MGDLYHSGLPVLLNTGAEAAGHGREFGLLSVDPGLIFWTVLTFLLLLVLLRKTAWGPIIEGLERREESIRNSLAEAESARDEGKKLLEQQQAELQESRKEAQRIIEQGTASAKAMQEEILAKAQVESGEIVESARKQLQVEVDRARETLRQEVVDISLQVAGKVLERSLNDDDHQQMAEEFMSQVEKAQ
jgi:F-type H+-transporting ATPase subunit b